MLRELKIDTSIHLLGRGSNNSRCYMDKRLQQKLLTSKFISAIASGGTNGYHDFDSLWCQGVSSLLKESEMDFGVVLGLDGFTNGSGAYEKKHTSLYVPEDWVFNRCRKHSNLLPGPSIHPYRADALSRLESCIKQGCTLIHWAPKLQNIDPAETRLKPYYKLLSEANIPLLVQCGDEGFLPERGKSIGRVDSLIAPLEAGVKVICGRSATHGFCSFERDQIPILRRLLLRYSNLTLDNSYVCSFSRIPNAQSLAKDPITAKKTLYGSGLGTVSLDLFDSQNWFKKSIDNQSGKKPDQSGHQGQASTRLPE